LQELDRKVSEGKCDKLSIIFFNPHGHGTHTGMPGAYYSGILQHQSVVETVFFVAELVQFNQNYKRKTWYYTG
jgi:hypothetical protein